MFKQRSDHFMSQFYNDIVRVVGFLGVSDHLNMVSFGSMIKHLKYLKSYKKVSDEELEHLLEQSDRKRWTYWTVHVVIKGSRKFITID